MDANMACDDVLTFAQINDSSGPIHLFVDSCIPAGWSILTLFDYQVCEDEPASCAEKTPEQCVMDDSCQVISGVPQVADETEACYHPGEATDVGCRDAGMTCMEALTFGIPSNDPASLHLFNDSCLPSGWEAIVQDDGTVYYHNLATGRTQWDEPVASGPRPGALVSRHV